MALKLIGSILPFALLAGCVATTDGPARPFGEANRCQVVPGQAFVGQKASQDTGSALLLATNASEIRWVAPGMAVTMDLKYGRLTVGYDSAMTITSVACT